MIRHFIARSPSIVALVQRNSSTLRRAVVSPSSRIVVPPTPATHLVVTRQLASKKKKKKGGGGKDFTVNFVFGGSDEMDDFPDDYGTLRFPSSTNLNEMKDHIVNEFELYGENMTTLEYEDDDGEWKTLTDPSKQLAGKKNVAVRSPDLLNDELDGDDDEYPYNDDDDDPYDDLGPNGGIGARVWEMVSILSEEGYTTQGQNQLKTKEGKVLDTKDYVLAAAEKDPDLQNMLVNKIGALDHLVMAIHFPFVWKDDQENDEADLEEEE